MKTVILCGGFGTRIRDVADDIPKPLVPVGPYPILWHIMKSYAQHGYNEFVLCVGYKGHAIKSFFSEFDTRLNDFTVTLGGKRPIEFHSQSAGLGWKVTLSDTGLHTMTGGRVRRIRKYVGDDEHFMLTYGDGVGDVDIPALVDFHKSHGKVLTVTGVRPPGRFGELEHDETGAVSAFNEKPQASAGRISGGFFVCRRELFDYLAPVDGESVDDLVLEKEPMRRLVAESQLMVFPHDGFWQPMDTARDYKLLNDLYESGRAPWAQSL